MVRAPFAMGRIKEDTLKASRAASACYEALSFSAFLAASRAFLMWYYYVNTLYMMRWPSVACIDNCLLRYSMRASRMGHISPLRALFDASRYALGFSRQVGVCHVLADFFFGEGLHFSQLLFAFAFLATS